jgi:epsilon-lactone hydrolase
VYLHGGGYVAGSIKMYAGLVSRLADATRSWIFMPNIPLAPEQQFPATHDAAIAAFRYAGSNTPSIPEKAASLFLAGDSCGAALALATGMRLRDEPESNPLSAIVGLSPTLDMTAAGDSYVRCQQTDLVVSREVTQQCIATYAPNPDPRNPMLSPIYGQFSGLPPVLLQVSDAEAVFDDSIAASLARQQGGHVEVQTWQGLPHVWHLLAPEATFAIQSVGEFIARRLGDADG